MRLNEWLDEQFGKIVPENEYQLLKMQVEDLREQLKQAEWKLTREERIRERRTAGLYGWAAMEDTTRRSEKG
jgi:ribosomal protein S9